MRRFGETCEAIAAAPGRNQKIRLAGEYLRSLGEDEAARAALLFCGRVFPRSDERVLSVGGALLWEAVTAEAGVGAKEANALYRQHGDLGAMTADLLAKRAARHEISLAEAGMAFDTLASTRGPGAKLAILRSLLARADGLSAKYLVRVMAGELRIGLKEGLVEEAIAFAYQQPAALVRRANMLTGDIAATLRMAARGTLNEATLRPLQAIGCMLASPVDSAAGAMEFFPAGALIEDKYDGVRAQAHKRGAVLKLFSRTLDELVEFSELIPPLLALPGDFVLDGEVVAWRDGRALPFHLLQQRLGRKQPDLWLPEAVPVSFVAFDLLYADGEPWLDRPLAERRERLERLLDRRSSTAVQLAPARLATTVAEVELAFSAALGRGNEGLMLKAPESVYAPGSRGRWWLKWKQPMATLDVVVTAVEYGHGKRHGLLSDYTFAVRGERGLVDIGKAFTGLTDQEIRRMTEFFLDHTVKDQGFRRTVEPTVVLEVAFNNIQRSNRHASGYALRFPRIVRLRPDKPASEIDTADRVRELFERQSGADHLSG